MYNDELYHYGVLGMRWGRRKTKEENRNAKKQLKAEKKVNKKVFQKKPKTKKNKTKGNSIINNSNITDISDINLLNKSKQE